MAEKDGWIKLFKKKVKSIRNKLQVSLFGIHRKDQLNNNKAFSVNKYT